MKAQAKFYRPVQERLILIAYASSGESGETSHLRSIARAFANCTKKKGCRWRLRPNFIGQFKKDWYLSHMRAAANQAWLHICAVSPGPLQIALKRRDVDEGSVKLYKPVKESVFLNAYASSEGPDERAHSFNIRYLKQHGGKSSRRQLRGW